jgi:hypothetical protein
LQGFLVLLLSRAFASGFRSTTISHHRGNAVSCNGHIPPQTYQAPVFPGKAKFEAIASSLVHFQKQTPTARRELDRRKPMSNEKMR